MCPEKTNTKESISKHKQRTTPNPLLQQVWKLSRIF